MTIRVINSLIILGVMLLMLSGCAYSSSIDASGSPSESFQSQSIISDNAMIFNEDNFTQFFRFGMSKEDVEKELRKYSIDFWVEESDGKEIPENYLSIYAFTGSIIFYFTDKNQLYEIFNGEMETAKGIQVDDPTEEIIQQYGKADEYDSNNYELVYHKSVHYFSISYDSKNNSVIGWRIFLAIWNQPINSKVSEPLNSDDVIKMNEENFKHFFRFGLTYHDVEEKLKSLKIRIVNETCVSIETDHVIFRFDENDDLIYIQVKGWETAKGLCTGDSENKLLRLYGSTFEYGSNNPDEKSYIFDFGNYSFMILMDDWYTENYAVDCWIVWTNDESQ